MRLLAYLRVEREEAEEAEREYRRRRDPKYERLLAEAQGNAPKSADEYLRQRWGKLRGGGR